MFDLKQFRKLRRLSQIQFSDKTGYNQGYISNIENGRELVSDKFLDKIEAVFDIDLSEYKSYNVETPVVSEPGASYIDYKAKYLEILEDYKRLADRLADCLESKVQKP